ncbi:MAG TPA: hypothetical protein VK908_12380 [Jiangellales bacterium]|nr:hypothetical protein [Jiangellales bacterium]
MTPHHWVQPRYSTASSSLVFSEIALPSSDDHWRRKPGYDSGNEFGFGFGAILDALTSSIPDDRTPDGHGAADPEG